MNTQKTTGQSLNNDDVRLVAIHNQRANYANWTHIPNAIEECERCGMRNPHSYLYKCYGCETLYCLTCVSFDPIFVLEYAEYVAIFCETDCKKRYMSREHPDLNDCDECHMMWPLKEYKKLCKECLNGVCEKCTEKISQGTINHKHLDWEDPTC